MPRRPALARVSRRFASLHALVLLLALLFAPAARSAWSSRWADVPRVGVSLLLPGVGSESAGRFAAERRAGAERALARVAPSRRLLARAHPAARFVASWRSSAPLVARARATYLLTSRWRC